MIPESEEGWGGFEPATGRESSPQVRPFPLSRRYPMTQTKPTLAALLPSSTVDFASVFAAQAEQEARADELRPATRIACLRR